ncbi:MAG: glycosyltransferase family 4 protein [Rhizobiales bacterium]|nr:glycosyltransferase family 4 protein [Hyphomicrobiales bacterium]
MKILHVFRAPLGGLFRHVVDLVRGQSAQGHHVGLVADSRTGGTRADEALDAIIPILKLGISRLPMRRHIGPSDIAAIVHVSRRIAGLDPDIVHGHGAKGAAYARLAAPGHRAIRAYTPHGGSLLYRPGTLASRFYVMLESVLMPRTDLFLFESSYSWDIYRAKVGAPRGLVRIVRNGIDAVEFKEILPAPDAADIVFIGELRPVKGIDTLLDALALLRRAGQELSCIIVGGGPSRKQLEAHADELGLRNAVKFLGPMPARDAFALGRLMVVPSRAESLPYIVLEAIAAGIPLISTNVGGIPEIFGPLSDTLIDPDDSAALTRAIEAARADPDAKRRLTATLRERVRDEFSVDDMVNKVIEAYRDTLANVHHSTN